MEVISPVKAPWSDHLKVEGQNLEMNLVRNSRDGVVTVKLERILTDCLVSLLGWRSSSRGDLGQINHDSPLKRLLDRKTKMIFNP